MIGQMIGHYRIVERIGAGGMGEVYRAHDEQLDRDVALKVLPSGTLTHEGARRQFRKEALTLAKLNHPNIETVHEFNSQSGVDFLAMELVPGSPLSHRLKSGALAELEVVGLGAQLAEALAVAHENGVIHRDLKPSNLMVTPDGRLKILDFGLALLLVPAQESDLTQSITTTSTNISGTVPYMSPEQLRGLPVDARSDIYAAGTVLYEMATGLRPFPQSQSAELIGAILHETPDPPRSRNGRISPSLESVIMKALEKDPAQRYQSAREFRIALEAVSRLVTLRRIFLQRLHDDAFQRRRDAAIARTRRIRSFVEDGADQLRALRLRKGPQARGHFVEHRSGGIDVAARVHGQAAQLLGRHVRHGAGDVRGGGGNTLREVAFLCRDEQERETKIQNLQAAVRRDHQVAGFEVAVDDAVLVGDCQSFGQLRAKANDFQLRQRAAFQPLAERAAGNKLHGQKVHAGLRVEFVDGFDVRVIELGESQGFFAELAARAFVCKRAGRPDLHRDVAIELLVVGAIVFPHAARADSLDDAVVADRLANHWQGTASAREC